MFVRRGKNEKKMTLQSVVRFLISMSVIDAQATSALDMYEPYISKQPVTVSALPRRDIPPLHGEAAYYWCTSKGRSQQSGWISDGFKMLFQRAPRVEGFMSGCVHMKVSGPECTVSFA